MTRGRTTGRVDALVTDGQSRAAVAGVRALGQVGLRSLVLGPERGSPALWSRHTAARAIGPRASEPGFIDRIAELAAEHGPFVVHPAQEEALDPIVDAGHRLPPEAIVPYGGAEPLRRLRDKAQLAALAEAAGLSAPMTLAEGPAGPIAAAPPPAPCVVKSTGRSQSLQFTRIVDSDAELRELLEGLPPEEPILVQERAGGPLVGLAVVLDRDGRVVAQFQQVARRMWPVVAGGSTIAVSVAPDLELIERTARMLSLAGHWGLAQLQYLTTSRGPALIDVNARYYGSLPLATACGVNLPAAWQAAAMGEQLPSPPPAYEAGVVYRWLEGDIRAALKGSRGHLRPPSPRARSGAMWATDDPVPSAILAGKEIWGPIGRRLPWKRAAR